MTREYGPPSHEQLNGRRNIVLIPGFKDGGNFSGIINRLEAEGHNVILPNIGRQLLSISSDLEDLALAIESEVEGQRSYVGYSMGGIMGLLIAQKNWDQVDGFVTVASPIGGLRVYLTMGLQHIYPAVGELKKSSHYIRSIKLDEIPPGKLTVVYGIGDKLARPINDLPNNVTTVRLEGGHTKVMQRNTDTILGLLLGTI